MKFYTKETLLTGISHVETLKVNFIDTEVVNRYWLMLEMTLKLGWITCVQVCILPLPELPPAGGKGSWPKILAG